MDTVERFRQFMLARIDEFTYRWWTDRAPEEQNFFYHVDDKFYEQVLRAEAAELLELVFLACRESAQEPMREWARRCSGKRAMQEVPIDESVERFRMFRRVLQRYFSQFALAENLALAEALQIAEELNNNCELAMQNYATEYMIIKEQYFNEQKKRFDMERLASIGQMAAGVAHEVRNPLTATRGFLQLLTETAPHHFLDIALQELDRGINTISTLLDVAKPNVQQGPMRPVSLCKVVSSVIDLFHDKLYTKHLELDLQHEDVLIEGREEMLKQAFFNVIKNSLEATKSSTNPTLTLRHYLEGDTAVVEIADNGVGIPADKLHLLGTPFFTLKDTGVGLGLTMVYRTMHEHCAQVAVESEAGQGARFRFLFPVTTL
jgi:signal transduction histidine kinase